MIASKLDRVTTYMDDTNYWAPLFIDDDEDEDHGNNEDRQDSTCASATDTDNHRRGLIQRMIRARLAQTNIKYGNKRNTASVVIDLGATSHFVQSSDNLPYLGQSQKMVKLPNGSTIQATHTVRLPFDTINEASRESHVLPDLKGNSLLSVPVLATNGYTTIFHA